MGLSLYVLVDTYFIANGIGKDGLIALNLVIPIYSGVLSALGLLIATGVGTLYSIYLGSGKKEEGQRLFTQVFIVGIIIGVLLSIFGVGFSKDIVKLLGATGRLISLSSSYLKTLFAFSIAFILNSIMLSMVRNDGNPKLAMLAMISGNVGNIILDYIFIVPFKMGMFGAALATGISPVISLGILSIHILQRQNNFKLIKTKLNLDQIRKVLIVGVPAFISEFSVGIVILMFNLVIIKIVGDIGVAAYGIMANISLVFTAMFTGIGQGIQPIISVSYGAKKEANIKKILFSGCTLALVLGIAFYLVCIIYPEPIIGAFNSENNVVLYDIAKKGMRLYFTAFVLMGMNVVVISFFSSIAKSKPAFIISMIRGFIVIIPAIFILPTFMGINGVWVIVPLVELFAFIVGSCMIVSFFKKAKTLQMK
jgi:putative MATE family efflux protein